MVVKSRILMVADERLVTEDLAEILINGSYEVVATAKAGFEAIKIAKEASPDLVLMNIMPEGKMDRIEAANVIRSELGIPIIYLTALADDDMLQRAKITRPFGYLVKPFSDKELIATIEMALKRHELENKLKISQEHLKAANEQLETRVSERTAHLQQVNQELEREIADRRNAEEALRESEQRLELALNGADLGLWDWYVQTGRTVVSRRSAEIIGYALEEIQQSFDFWVRMLHPKDRNRALESVYAHLEGRTDYYEDEYRVKAKSAEWKWIFSRGKVVERDPDGKPVRMTGTYLDITDRKRTEESLKNLVGFRQTLIDSIPNPVFYKDIKGRYLGCNEAFAALVGLPKEKVVGKSVYEIVPKQLADIWRGKDQELFDRPYIQIFEFTIPHPDGAERTLVNHKAPFFDPDGALAGLIGVMVDITDRLRAEEAVRQSEERYRTLVEESFDGIFVQNGSKIIFANSRLYDMLGYSQGELEGLDHWIIYHPEYQEITRVRAVARMRGEEVVPQYEVKLQRKDGSTFDGEISARAVKVKGEPGVQVWVRDVSKRKRSEEVQRRLATAVEQAVEAIVITDTEGNIQYVNPAFEQTSGYTQDETLGQNPKLLKSGEHDRAFYENLWDTITRGQVWTGCFINKRKDGSLYHEDSTISPVRDSRGKIVNYVAVKRDITEHLKLSRQLLQAQKMEAIGTLAGGIAHDFNNLLQVTLGFSELLLAEKREDDPDYADLSKILQSARSGAELVQGLLTFSRKVEPKPIPLNLNRRIRQVEKLLRRTIPKIIDIQMDLSGDLAEIDADPTQMEQLLMNLAVNARDAMPDGGKLIVGTRNVALDEEYCRIHAGAKPGEYVLLTVADTGHGMDKATIDHIFEPFYTTKESGRGTGLGLATVYGIVNQHRGHITCESELGKGTTFSVYLPAIESQLEPEVEGSEAVPAFGTETVLLVEDEDVVRDLGERILSKGGYKVLTAADGRDACVLFRKKRKQIALIILDLIMPEMGGQECLRELLKIDPQVKVLIASGYSAAASAQGTRESEAKGFVVKPFRMKELLKQVRKVLDAS
ncbi:MAG: PAS domain S-box protein [Desulfomonilaceae bacterium]